MRIVVDLQSCQSGSLLGGIGRYSADLLRAMIVAFPEHEYIILLNELFQKTGNDVRARFRNLVPPSNFVYFPAPEGCATARGVPSLTRSAEILRENFINNLNPDVVHISSLVEGLHDDIVTSIGRIQTRTPTVATLYDLIPMVERDTYLRSPVARAHYFDKVRSLTEADALLAISEFVAEESKALLPGFKGTLANIRGGIDPKFKKIGLKGAQELRRKLRLSRPFILYTASYDLRKNQPGLIKAFSRIPLRQRQQYQLVFVGGGSPEVYQRLTRLGEESGLRPGEMVFLGRVSDEDLVTLYNICNLFVFPSRLEGLGMPALEAMACGAPVVGSKTSSLPEVIGWDAALFDPDDHDEMAEKIKQGLFDQSFRRESVARAQRHVRSFTWENSAKIAMGVLTSVAKPPSVHSLAGSAIDALMRWSTPEDLVDRHLESVARLAVVSDLRREKPWASEPFNIGWVTSWDARCGIASYSQQLIEALPVKPLIFASYKSSEGKEPARGVLRCWEEGKTDCLVELMNSVGRERLDAVHFQFNYGFFEFDALNNLLLSLTAQGVAVFLTLHSTLDQAEEPSFRLDRLYPALRTASGIFVHSRYDVERLAAMGLSKNVVLIPHFAPSFPTDAGPQNDGVMKLATYGFALPGKGLEELVEAVAILRDRGQRIHLYLVDANYGDSYGLSDKVIASIEAAINSHELADDVTLVTDFLTDEQSLELIRRADIVVYPYSKTGESGSGAVRLGLASGRPVAATPFPIFDDVKEAVYQLPGVSAKEIAQGLNAMFEKIVAKDAEIATLRDAAQRLLSVTSPANVSAFLDDYMRMRTYFNTFAEVFGLDMQRVCLANGQRKDNAIFCSKKGLVCYGPYEELEPGVYRVIVRGTLKGSSAKATVRLRASTKLIAVADLEDLGEGILCDIIVIANTNFEAVELLFDLATDGELVIHNYVVMRQSL